MPRAARNANRLLGLLPPAERTDVLRRCTEVPLHFGEVLTEPGQLVRHVHFPLDGFISMIVTIEGHNGLEVGLVGNEGMFGLSLALGQNRTPLRSLVQGEGTALRIAADDFRSVFSTSPALRKVVFGYIHVQLSQLAQIAACTRFHNVEQRFARWMLMTHDRAQEDTFRITHELMAEMLGVRRAGVSTVASDLQAQGLISYQRGLMTVLDRPGLERTSCECYRASLEIYRCTLG